MSQLNRRSFLKLSSATLIGITAGTYSIQSFAAERLATNDPLAAAMRYVTQSATEGQICNNCMHYGTAAKDEGSCVIFGGKLVAKDGWCSAWVKKA